ncbi:MAG: hypothetical protein CM1200mP30_12630 [Pseudomonadota bacterium]|nr:MAG: hypothetical protein CM1200mP30_12630 [Pseudomonadota bacterium]
MKREYQRRDKKLIESKQYLGNYEENYLAFDAYYNC